MLESALAQLQGEIGTRPLTPGLRPSTPPSGQVSTPLRGGIGELTTQPPDYPRHVPSTRSNGGYVPSTPYYGGGHHPSTNGGQLGGGIGSLTTLPPGYPRYRPSTPYNRGHTPRSSSYYPRQGPSTPYNGGHGSRTSYYPRHLTTPNGRYNCTVRGPRRRLPGRPCIGPLCRRRPLPHPPGGGRGWPRPGGRRWPRPMPPPRYPRYGPSTPPNGGYRRPQWPCFGPLCRLPPRSTATPNRRERPRAYTTPLLRRWPFP